MKPHTRVLHETLLRCFKGIIAAYDRWLKESSN
ncbi:MAG: hypothetical protein RL194_328 [Pseudomonadota bacterium]|jgi:hypothetical protein